MAIWGSHVSTNISGLQGGRASHQNKPNRTATLTHRCDPVRGTRSWVRDRSDRRRVEKNQSQKSRRPHLSDHQVWARSAPTLLLSLLVGSSLPHLDGTSIFHELTGLSGSQHHVSGQQAANATRLAFRCLHLHFGSGFSSRSRIMLSLP